MSIKNTTNTPHRDWLLGGNPEAIENQEKEGQNELVESAQLPRKINNNSIKYFSAKEFYEAIGIKVLGESKGDELFYDVELPKYLRIESTDHSMWNNLVDVDDQVRAQIFYKAAFYDRDAFINVQKLK